jgi:hypothetical protein
MRRRGLSGISDGDHFRIHFQMKEFNCTREIGMKDDPEHNAILKALFSVFLLFVWSALVGSLTVLIQLLFNLPPSGYQFIPLGIFCSLYVLNVMRAARKRAVNCIFLVMPVVPLHWSMVSPPRNSFNPRRPFPSAASSVR